MGRAAKGSRFRWSCLVFYFSLVVFIPLLPLVLLDAPTNGNGTKFNNICDLSCSAYTCF